MYDISIFEHACIYLFISNCYVRHITIFVLFWRFIFCVAPLHFLIRVDCDCQQRWCLSVSSHQISSDLLMSTVRFLISYSVTVCQRRMRQEFEACSFWWPFSATFDFFSLKLLIHRPWVSPESPELNHHFSELFRNVCVTDGNAWTGQFYEAQCGFWSICSVASRCSRTSFPSSLLPVSLCSMTAVKLISFEPRDVFSTGPSFRPSPPPSLS